MTVVGENIKKIRKMKGLTQRKLADKSGVSYSMICKLESGEQKNPSLHTLEKIADALDVLPYVFHTGEKNTGAIDKIIAERSYRDFKAAWQHLTKKQKEGYRLGKYQFSYQAGEDTFEAICVKASYLHDEITEEEYKAYCLKSNLLENE